MAHEESGNPAPMPRRGRARRWIGWGLLALVVLAVGLLLMSALLRRSPAEVAMLASTVRSLKLLGVLVQVALVVWIAVAWRWIVGVGLRRGVVARHEVERVLALRWTVFAFLVAYLLLVPIGSTTIHRFLVQ